MATPITEATAVIRSKNAGPYELTLDMIFKTSEIYEKVKKSGVFTREYFAELYGVKPETVLKVIFFDPSYAIKVTMKRIRPSGDIYETDVYGAQQHGPLLGIVLDI